MFCSGCGKTLKAEWKKCEYCGLPIGESRFNGIPYTAAQQRIYPGAEPLSDLRQYTRTVYTGGDYDEYTEDEGGTTYRPLYSASSVPEDFRHDVRVAIGRESDEEEFVDDMGEQADEEYIDDEESAPEKMDSETFRKIVSDFDPDVLRARPIVKKNKPGLSSDVEEYVRMLEGQDAEPEAAPRRGKHMAQDDPYAENSADGENADENADDDDDMYDEPRGFTAARIIKIVVALLVVAALFVAGVYFAPKIIDKFKKEASAPIEGVSLDLYNNSVELIKNHTLDTYRSGVLTTFQNGGYAALTTRLNADKALFRSMMPAEPGANDELFITAISAIQDDIGSALTMDAVEISTAGKVESTESAERWQTVADSVAGFEQIRSTDGLNAVISGERIVAEVPTPSPAPQSSPAPEYQTLTKGDDGEAVQKLQERLWELGYLEDDRDGKFGGNTQTAVKLFQQTAGFEVTGVADNAMQILLFSDDAPMTNKAKITPAPVVTDAPLTIDPSTAPDIGDTAI